MINQRKAIIGIMPAVADLFIFVYNDHYTDDDVFDCFAEYYTVLSIDIV